MKASQDKDDVELVNTDGLRMTHDLDSSWGMSHCITGGGQKAAQDEQIMEFRNCILDNVPEYLVISTSEPSGRNYVSDIIYDRCYRTSYARRSVAHDAFWNALHQEAVLQKDLFENDL